MKIETHELVIRLAKKLNREREMFSHEHGSRVSIIAHEFGTMIGLPATSLEKLEIGASLHDLGKLGIPEMIINKVGKLLPWEYIVMQQHTTIGHGLGMEAKLDPYVLDIIHHHHENFDGSGYPDRQREHQISYAAMIVHIADVYDALTEKRTYHQTYSHDQAIEVMLKDHRKYNPELLAVFTENVQRWTDQQ